MTASSPAAAEPRASSASSLVDLLRSGAKYKEIAAHLDALSSARRLEEMLAVSGKNVGKLYEAVADAPAVVVDEFVLPTELETTVIYEGRNSLPMFTRFQKRFYRRDANVIVGYNHQTMSFVTGPGYFVMQGPSGEGPHPTEPYFDYTAEPSFQPPGWPTPKSNRSGLSKPVYGNMKDYIRRVARGIIVGKAYKNDVSQDAFFSLTRAE